MSVKSTLSNVARTMSGQKRAELAIETIKHNQPITASLVEISYMIKKIKH